MLYLALEEKRAEVRRHFAAMGATAEDPISVLCATAPEDGLPRLRLEAERRRPALIIVDPLFRLVRVPDGNDYATVSSALEPLLSVARDSGAHVLAVHHMRKGAGGDDGDCILGSTAIHAAVDTALILRRGDRYRTLASIQRYGDDLSELTLALDADTRWITAGTSRSDADEADAGRAILEYLAVQAEPVEEPAIHEGVEARRSVKQKALRRLAADGRITRTGSGRRGDSYPYAVSGTDVPGRHGEPENQNPEQGVSAGRDGVDARTDSLGRPSRVPESDPMLALGPAPRRSSPRCAAEASPAHDDRLRPGRRIPTI